MTELDRERMFRLIPEARDFEWVKDLTPVGWLANTGSLGQAIAYAELFWPNFVEHDGCILLSGRFDQDNFQSWLAATGGDRTAVEGVTNHTHILDLFCATSLGADSRASGLAGPIAERNVASEIRPGFP